VTTVLVPLGRVARWVSNFETRHGAAELSVLDGALHGRAPDGSTFAARLPFAREYAGPSEVAALVDAAAPPSDWGVLIVRRGGFAVARLHGSVIDEVKVGRRHVQGRTKAGGWSQQRFARRRSNQARAAFAAAGEHAERILDGLDGPLVYAGEDAEAPEGSIRLAGHVPDPRRDVLEKAIADAGSVAIEVVNAG
jgi:hypothetical protein